jgi:hypothetical protein
MRKKKDHYRNAKLEFVINSLFGKLWPDDIDKISEAYEHSITEMFQVYDVNKKSISLMHLFEDVLYEPVIVDESLILLLKLLDTFLMTLVFKDNVWYLIWSSGPYS